MPPPGGWHDTGDVVSIDEDGFIAIRGRLKRFAKIGGETVSLAVVENVAAALWPDNAHAAVAVPDGRKGEQIVLLTDAKERAARGIDRVGAQSRRFGIVGAAPCGDCGFDSAIGDGQNRLRDGAEDGGARTHVLIEKGWLGCPFWTEKPRNSWVFATNIDNHSQLPIYLCACKLLSHGSLG